MKLKTFQSDDELRKIQRYFKSVEGQYAHGDTLIGVCMGQQAMLKKTTKARCKELYNLCLRRHDRINDWDPVDLAAKPASASTSPTGRARSCASPPNRRTCGSAAQPSTPASGSG
ncbi:MAG: hypothetical protein ABL956_05925 [Hyphomonadaceae bacterium]